VEALVRWRHPSRGVLAPVAFLEAAEEIGVMTAIDDWALVEACRQCRVWHDQAPGPDALTVSVNLSNRAFASETLVARVAGILEAAGLPARCLRLEVTESAAMADPARTRLTLDGLRALGVRVSLDDFGTGYCSLSYLQQLPVDVLKIDKSFVSQIEQPGGNTDIIRLIVSLAQTLGLEVVAEGTETLPQIELLSNLGVQYGQGYYFSKPVPADAIHPPVDAAS
jgi:EAL domain-containing protein (putative c-di-GMP-specific phosphodiesterase class I)